MCIELQHYINEMSFIIPGDIWGGSTATCKIEQLLYLHEDIQPYHDFIIYPGWDTDL